jgi:hypothetical protein
MLLHYQVRTLLVLSPALAAYLAATLAFVITRRRFGAWARAWWWLITHVGAIRAMRAMMQRARRVGDREVLEGGPIPLAPGLIRHRVSRFALRMFERVLNAYWGIARGALR